jgi:hypothetical protein
MSVLVEGLQVVVGLVSLVCFVLVLIRMFQEGQSGLGIVCIVLFLVCGVGYLITFIYGWIKAREWGISSIMLTWTGCIAAGIILGLVGAVVNSGDGGEALAVLTRIGH